MVRIAGVVERNTSFLPFHGANSPGGIGAQGVVAAHEESHSSFGGDSRRRLGLRPRDGDCGVGTVIAASGRYSNVSAALAGLCSRKVGRCVRRIVVAGSMVWSKVRTNCFCFVGAEESSFM